MLINPLSTIRVVAMMQLELQCVGIRILLENLGITHVTPLMLNSDFKELLCGVPLDVLILDAQLDDSGEEKRLLAWFHDHTPTMPILKFVHAHEPLSVLEQYECGLGLISTTHSGQLMADALKTVLSGQRFIDPLLTTDIKRLSNRKHWLLLTLTQAQYQVLTFLEKRAVCATRWQLLLPEPTSVDYQAAKSSLLNAMSVDDDCALSEYFYQGHQDQWEGRCQTHPR